MEKPIQISVIICSYNRESVLQKTLDHIALQSDRDFELIIVNNNSTDSTDNICSDFVRNHSEMPIVCVNELNQGLSYARNRGIKEASGNYLTFLDDDAFAFPDYIENLKAFLEKHPDAKAGGGKIIPFYESAPPKWMSKYLLSLIAALDMGDKVALFKGKAYPIGANMFIHRSIFDKGLLFNVKLGRKGKNLDGGEEKEVFLSIKKRGIPVYYVPNIVVEHWAPDARLTDEFFTRQAIGIGYSERIRSKNISSNEYRFSLLKEGLKWVATITLFCVYSLSGRYVQGKQLVKFRKLITQGLLYKDCI